ncbi:MAG TPA: class I SAM-dependent methyltransferase [Galbitalea sp.]|nr:class I SAM-dependent methyltransferase [Galbitalea sp.]
MNTRPHADGSAGDVDYARIASGYSDYRRPEPRIEAAILAALGDAVTVLNVGAGAGSYEPVDRTVTAVEPSASMRAQRPAGRPAIDATAESLPFDDAAFDASMATFSVHQWADVEAGLAEMRRVTRGPVVILSCDPELIEQSWLAEYAPEVMAAEAARYPVITRMVNALGGDAEVVVVPIPFECVDGFNQAYYGRPERLLDPGARAANSAWTFVGADVEGRFVRDLGADLESGVWDEKYGYLRGQGEFDGALRLVVARSASRA